MRSSTCVVRSVGWQVEYAGRRETSREPGVAETTIAAANNFYVAKEEQVRYVDDLLADFVYTFNISAKFLDATFGPPTTLRVQTSAGALSHEPRR